MAFGLIPARGTWENRLVNTSSAATYGQGDLVMLNGARDMIVFTSASTQYYGVALHSSVNSLPAGKVLVAIPTENCTVQSDLTNSYSASGLSIGQAGTIARIGNNVSFFTTTYASVFSAICQVVGPVDNSSGQSRIELAFFANNRAIYSASSLTIA